MEGLTLGGADLPSLKNRLCVALDYVHADDCFAMGRRLGPHAGLLKVGLQSFANGGPELVRALREHAPIFLDLKFHDIPAQVKNAINSIKRLSVAMTTVHAAGGESMLRAAAEEAGDSVVVLAVTVLTSLDEGDLRSAGVTGTPQDQVLRLADLALSSGVPGLVCSPLEVQAIRSRFGPREDGGPLLVVPGIRPPGANDGDQKRVLSPFDARAAGADILVVGRPVTEANDPVVATQLLAEQAM